MAVDANATRDGAWPVTVRAKAYADQRLLGEAEARFDVLDRRAAPPPATTTPAPPPTPPPEANDAPGFGLLVVLAAAGLAIASKKR